MNDTLQQLLADMQKHVFDEGCACCQAKDYIERLEAACAEPSVARLPVNWVLVPSWPTLAMVKAGRDWAKKNNGEISLMYYTKLYVAMLAAAPSPEPQP